MGGLRVRPFFFFLFSVEFVTSLLHPLEKVCLPLYRLKIKINFSTN